jgi:hypothetical protein
MGNPPWALLVSTVANGRLDALIFIPEFNNWKP